MPTRSVALCPTISAYKILYSGKEKVDIFKQANFDNSQSIEACCESMK